MNHQSVICIVGLGYVGMPLAHAFAAKGYKVAGYDVDAKRIEELKARKDRTGELTSDQLSDTAITFSNQPDVIADAEVIILALPTPVDGNNKPDITILKSATKTTGENMKKGAIVVFESTVSPGTTEEICGPILEDASGMKCGEDFFLGYSPERINPGDKEHTVTKIIKIVAGQNDEVTDRLCALYGDVIEAGIHRAPSIKVAEMAKAIENAQRDLNIAFVNEVAMLCGALGIPTKDVLEAAKTKWNFLPFQPGLVGGHCIGVDPYYLVEKARELGMETQVITAGRGVNDGMGQFVANQIIDALGNTNGKSVLILGLTFKEDVPDTRNSKVGDVVKSLEAAGCDVKVHDPHYDSTEVESFGYTAGSLDDGPYDAIALLVPHKEYRDAGEQNLVDAINENGVIYDLKSVLQKTEIENEGKIYRAL